MELNGSFLGWSCEKYEKRRTTCFPSESIVKLIRYCQLAVTLSQEPKGNHKRRKCTVYQQWRGPCVSCSCSSSKVFVVSLTHRRRRHAFKPLSAAVLVSCVVGGVQCVREQSDARTSDRELYFFGSPSPTKQSGIHINHIGVITIGAFASIFMIWCIIEKVNQGRNNEKRITTDTRSHEYTAVSKAVNQAVTVEDGFHDNKTSQHVNQIEKQAKHEITPSKEKRLRYPFVPHPTSGYCLEQDTKKKHKLNLKTATSLGFMDNTAMSGDAPRIPSPPKFPCHFDHLRHPSAKTQAVDSNSIHHVSPSIDSTSKASTHNKELGDILFHGEAMEFPMNCMQRRDCAGAFRRPSNPMAKVFLFIGDEDHFREETSSVYVDVVKPSSPVSDITLSPGMLLENRLDVDIHNENDDELLRLQRVQ